MDLRLAGQSALITGGSQGIGLAIARRLAEEGVALTLVARGEASLEEARAELTRDFGVEVRTVSADLADPDVPARLAERFGDVDILVNVANKPSGGSLESVADDQWMRNWAVKPFGYIRMIRAFAPVLRQRGGGVIVNLIGDIGMMPSYKAIYSAASCNVLYTVTRGLAHELAQANVRIVGVNAWVVDTPHNVEAYARRAETEFGDPDRWRDTESYQSLPFGRGARPDEIGDLVTFVASPRAAYLTGEIIALDGGYASSSIPALASGPPAVE